MNRMVFVWRESVYKNGFKCKCGNLLADPQTGEPKGYVRADVEGQTIYCNKCGQPVCCFGEMETDLPAGMHGDINSIFKADN